MFFPRKSNHKGDFGLDITGADPELLLGGGANPWGGALPNILVVFSEKPYEIKEILIREGGAARRGRPPLNPPLHYKRIEIPHTSETKVYYSLTNHPNFRVPISQACHMKLYKCSRNS